ncbi:hypothetical protein C2E23DRAFT_883648 [Lenzites betulinus]|nr:hypothetical protein C2E23DRAFT_883648 [Lenzites betulinus]
MKPSCASCQCGDITHKPRTAPIRPCSPLRTSEPPNGQEDVETAPPSSGNHVGASVTSQHPYSESDPESKSATSESALNRPALPIRGARPSSHRDAAQPALGSSPSAFDVGVPLTLIGPVTLRGSGAALRGRGGAGG